MNLEYALQILGGDDFVSREGGMIFFGFSCLVLLIGLAVGLVFWKQLRTLATMIEEDTRQNQSDYDLVSRDIMKIKHDVSDRARQIPTPKK